MIQVKVSNNMKRNTVVVEDSTTIRQVLEQEEIDYSTGMTMLDGSTLGPGDLDKSFAQFGITERCFLSSIKKLDNA